LDVSAIELVHVPAPRWLKPPTGPELPVTLRPRHADDDRALAEGLRRGDPEALRALHAAHGVAILALLRRLLRDASLAEDVFQQVMTEVWQRGAQYDAQRGSLIGWVLTIARSRAIDELRRRVPRPSGDVMDDLMANGATPGHSEGVVSRRLILDLLAEVPEDERLPLVLRFYAGLSQSEIADTLEVPLGTVKSRMVRGLERLRERLRQEEVPAEVGP